MAENTFLDIGAAPITGFMTPYRSAVPRPRGTQVVTPRRYITASRAQGETVH